MVIFENRPKIAHTSWLLYLWLLKEWGEKFWIRACGEDTRLRRARGLNTFQTIHLMFSSWELNFQGFIY